MRIIKTAEDSHRYAKVLSTTSQGIIGRLYMEIEDRKNFEATTSVSMNAHNSLLELLKYQVASIKVQNKRISDIVSKIFPDGETWAIIDKDLLVRGVIKGDSLEVITTEGPPIVVASTQLVKNLNAEMLSGNKLTDIEKSMDTRIGELSRVIAGDLKVERTKSDTAYAPKSHVNAGGPGIHPYVTTKLAGFMSPTDKLNHDKIKEKTDQIELPGGMLLSDSAPEAPRMMEVWIDTSDMPTRA